MVAELKKALSVKRQYGVLAMMQSNQNSHAVLVGMQVGTVTLWLSNSTHRPNRNTNISPRRDTDKDFMASLLLRGPY